MLTFIGFICELHGPIMVCVCLQEASQELVHTHRCHGQFEKEIVMQRVRMSVEGHIRVSKSLLKDTQGP